MPRDSQGINSLPVGTIVNSGDTVLPSQHNPAMLDLSSGISGSLSRDGLGGMRADLPMGGFKATNMAPGTLPTDGATFGQVGASGVPIGSVLDFAGSAAPTGWLLCYGQAVSRTAYADLFAAIGVQFGVGDGSTTFNLPDTRGRVAAGKDNMGGANAGLLSIMDSTTLGGKGGSQVHTLTVDQIPSHSHGVTDPSHNHEYSSVTPTGGIGSGSGFGQSAVSTSSSFTGISIQNNGGGLPHNNIQPTIIFNKIIRVS